MKIAVVGKGNTGQAVLDLLGSQSVYEIFDSSNTVTVEKLNNADAVIIFVSAKVLADILPILLETTTPLFVEQQVLNILKMLLSKLL